MNEGYTLAFVGKRSGSKKHFESVYKFVSLSEDEAQFPENHMDLIYSSYLFISLKFYLISQFSGGMTGACHYFDVFLFFFISTTPNQF